MSGYFCSRGDIIASYKIIFPIRLLANYATYCAKTVSGELVFLEMGDCNSYDFINNNIIHESISSLLSYQEIFFKDKKMHLCTYSWLVGESLKAKINREGYCLEDEVKCILKSLVNIARYLNSIKYSRSVFHPQNIILDFYERIPQVHLYLSTLVPTRKSKHLFLNEVEDYFFDLPVSSLDSIMQNQILSLGIVIYYLIFGIPQEYRSRPFSLTFQYNKLDFSKPVFDSYTINWQMIIERSLGCNFENRFISLDDFEKVVFGNAFIKSEQVENKFCASSLRGFDAIAGMENLKTQLKNEVIDVIRNPEEYKAHCLNIPNGLLLYGPPGCGKTFFAQKFAEETGFHFEKIIPSDIASIYIHGTQEKIKSIFDRARKNAPCVLFFDEINSMMPCRDSEEGIRNGVSGEVNEFLTQLDNIGDQQVFVIATTNYPNKVDPAVLRAGRLELKFYLPPPDEDARESIFKLYLSKRPIESSIDYKTLASLTECYVAADIKFIVDKSSRATIRHKHSHIKMETIVNMIKETPATVSKIELSKYEAIRSMFDRR